MPPQPIVVRKSDWRRADTRFFAAQFDTCDSPKAVSHLLTSCLNQTLPLPPIRHWTVNCELLRFFHGIYHFHIFRWLPDDKNKRINGGGMTIELMTIFP